IKERAMMSGFAAPGSMGTLQTGPAGLAVDEASNRLLVATSRPKAVHVLDISKGEWIGVLQFGMDALPDDHIAVSPDGRWVVINVTEVLSKAQGARGGGAQDRARFKNHILIFDLSSLERVPDPSG